MVGQHFPFWRDPHGSLVCDVAGDRTCDGRSQRHDVSRQLQQIANALNEYADRHGTYPPPVVFDAAGKPLYSWRVLILPQLGYQDLYDGFYKDQVWDSPSKLNLVRSMPKSLQSW